MDIKQIFNTVSPWIGAALGGPLGSLALNAVGKALGVSDINQKTIESALINATPEQLLAVKEADNSFAIQMQQLGFANIEKLESIASDDRKNARELQISTRSKVPALLSFAVTFGYFSVLLGMLSNALSVADSQALLLMLGSLSTAWGMVMAYWFGTTSDSGRKTDILAKK